MKFKVAYFLEIGQYTPRGDDAVIEADSFESAAVEAKRRYEEKPFALFDDEPFKAVSIMITKDMSDNDNFTYADFLANLRMIDFETLKEMPK